jgi:hypothetical protein
VREEAHYANLLHCGANYTVYELFAVWLVVGRRNDQACDLASVVLLDVV